MVVRPLEDAVGEFPVLIQALALVGEHRRARSGDRGRRMVLGRVDIAGRPAHLGAQRLQRFDQHRGLDGHVQTAGDAGAAQRLSRAILLTNVDQARHLGFGDGDFPPSPGRQVNVGDVVVHGFQIFNGCIHCRVSIARGRGSVNCGASSLASAVSADPTGANGQPVPLPPGRSAPRSPLRSGPQPNPAADRSSSAMSVTSQLTPRSSRPR